MSALKEEALGHAEAFERLANSLDRRRQHRALLEWIASLPPEVAGRAPVRMARSHSLAFLGEWQALAGDLEHVRWPGYEHLRRALRARALRALEARGQGWKAEWQEARREALAGPRNLRELARFMAGWDGWTVEWCELLWNAASGHPAEAVPALATLEGHYRGTREARGLRRVAERLLALDPQNPNFLNNWAYYSLVLGVETQRAHQMAERLHREHPGHPNIASTRALSLLLQDRAAEALPLVESIARPERVPALGALTVAVLRAAGRTGEAADLSRRVDVRALLPEEQAWLGAGPR